MSFPTYEGHQTFSTVPTIVNSDDYTWIVLDPECIIVIVLLILNFNPQKTHHSLTKPKSRFRDSPTLTLPYGDAATATKIESSA